MNIISLAKLLGHELLVAVNAFFHHFRVGSYLKKAGHTSVTRDGFTGTTYNLTDMPKSLTDNLTDKKFTALKYLNS
jgi:hypothetical protein